MADPKNTENAKSASPSQDIVKPGQSTTSKSDSKTSTAQDIVKPK